MKAPDFPKLFRIMAIFFALGHLCYAGILVYAGQDQARTEKVQTPRQAAPFALDILLTAGLCAVGTFAAGTRLYVAEEDLRPVIRRQRTRFQLTCLALAVLEALMAFRSAARPEVSPVMRHHIVVALLYWITSLQVQRRFRLTEAETARYEKQ